MTPSFSEFKSTLLASLTQGMLSWPVALTAVTMALILYFDETRKSNWSARSAFRYLFPRGLYSHRSAVQDYWIFPINIAISSFLFFFVVLDPQVKPFVEVLRSILGPSPLSLQPTIWLDIAYTLWLFVAIDFGQYVAHYIMHKWPPLWAFHKVHHSAEVLTPLTASRDHPVDDIFTVLCALAIYYPIAAFFHYFVGATPFVVQVGGMDILSFVAFLLYGHFKHSHLWIRFPDWISRIVASPAMHQIHHSCLEPHIDKNLGGTLSVWDWIFGTLHVPTEEEKDRLVYGINVEQPNPYDRLPKVYYEPFVDSGNHLLKSAKRLVGRARRRVKTVSSAGIRNRIGGPQ